MRIRLCIMGLSAVHLSDNTMDAGKYIGDYYSNADFSVLRGSCVLTYLIAIIK